MVVCMYFCIVEFVMVVLFDFVVELYGYCLYVVVDVEYWYVEILYGLWCVQLVVFVCVCVVV